MKHLVTYLFVSLFFVKANAQNTYQILYGSTDLYAKLEITSMKQTSDGGSIATGFTFNYGVNGKVYLLKTKADGSLQWFKIYRAAKSTTIIDTTQETYPTNAFSVQQTADGGYIVAGRAWVIPNGGLQDAYFLKTDSAGNVEWQKIYGDTGDEQANTIVQTKTGEYIVTGFTQSYDDSTQYSSKVYVLKLSGDGNVIWTNTYRTNINTMDEGVSVIETADNNYVLYGISVTKFTAERALLLMKIDAAAGNVLWSKTYASSSSGFITGSDVKQTPDGGFIVSGVASEDYSTESDIFLMKVNATGDVIQWAKSIATEDSAASEVAGSLIVTADGGYALYGNVNYYPADKQYPLLIKTDDNGNVSWGNQYGGGSGNGFGKSVVQTGDGGFMLGSYQNIDFGFEGSTGYGIKTDSLGHCGCNERVVNATSASLDFSVKDGPAAKGSLDSSAEAFIISSEEYFPITVLCQNPAPELTFTAFNGKNMEGKNVLGWRTTSEIKSDYYEVQKSTDKRNFVSIGKVNATFKTFSTRPYTFTDTKQVQGTNYYRIKAVRNNKRIFYSNIIVIKTTSSNLITANNTNVPGLLLVKSEKAYDAPYIEYNIFNASGSKVYQGKLENTNQKIYTTLNLSFLKTGFYYISFTTKEGIVNQKIVITH